MSIYMLCVCVDIYGQASGVPSPPTQWYGLYGVGGLGEGWYVRRGVGALEKRPGVTDQAGIVRKPYASHKSYNVAQ